MTPHTLRHALNRAHYSTLEPGYRVNGSTAERCELLHLFRVPAAWANGPLVFGRPQDHWPASGGSAQAWLG